MVTLPLYHICLICTAIESPPQGGLLPQGANKAYVILLPEVTYVSQNELFALLNGSRTDTSGSRGVDRWNFERTLSYVSHTDTLAVVSFLFRALRLCSASHLPRGVQDWRP